MAIRAPDRANKFELVPSSARPEEEYVCMNFNINFDFQLQCTVVPLSTRMLLWSKFSMYFGQLLQEHSIQN